MSDTDHPGFPQAGEPGGATSIPVPASIIITSFPDLFTTSGTRLGGDWATLARNLALHEVGEKDGRGICLAEFHGEQRATEHLICRTGVALDIETNKKTGEIPPPPWDVAEQLAQLKIASVVYTTYSHEEDAPRYRIVAPLSQPFRLDHMMFTLDPFIGQAFAKLLHLDAVTDHSKLGSSSLFFTARHPAGRNNMRYSEVIEGFPLDFKVITDAAIRVYTADMKSQRDQIRAGIGLNSRTRAVIDDFNRCHPLNKSLAKYGYKRRGVRWKSPLQSRGSAGATIIKRETIDGVVRERWTSFSNSDGGAGVGAKPKKSSPVTCFGDTFSLYQFFEHNNDFKAAIKGAAQRVRTLNDSVVVSA